MVDEEQFFLCAGISLIGSCALFFSLRKIPRTKGKNVHYHAAFLIAVGVILLFVPDYIQNFIFSKGGVLVIGTIIPIFESVKAACTIDEEDDASWLQFWLASGAFTHCTEFMDVIAENFPLLAERWYEFEFFTLLWFLLPFTDGSGLLYEVITEPYITPMASKLKEKLDWKIQILLLTVNSGYLWVVWLTFMTLEEEARRTIVIVVGTVYPLAASTVALATKSNRGEDTFWLTYWSCFSILFIMMDHLENFIGSIRGFYSICLCATVYLFLPMFRGAAVIFRNVLVPLCGHYENMLLKDVHILRLDIEKKLPQSKQKDFFAKARMMFGETKED